MKIEMNDIYQVIAKHLAGESSEKEEIILKEWFELSDENKKQYEDLKQGWQGLDLHSSPADKTRVLENVKKRINEVGQKTEKPAIRLFGKSWYRAVASVLLAVSLGTLAWYQLNEPFSMINTIGYEVQECEAGNQKDFLLVDGSRIWMNGDSRIKYKTGLKGEKRNVFLEGEAFFDVARDEQKPFVISLDGAEVKVMGTSFNVKAYPEDKVMETSVLTGKVAFSRKHRFLKTGKNERLYLKPGQKGMIGYDVKSIRRINANNQLDIAWMNRNLNFENTPLLELTKILYRMYGVEFKLTDSDLKDLKITASFKNEELKEIMKILEMTNEFSHKMEKGIVVIGKKDDL